MEMVMDLKLLPGAALTLALEVIREEFKQAEAVVVELVAAVVEAQELMGQ